MPWEISAIVIKEVVEEHAEEASFLWLLRDNAVLAPNYQLNDLANLDKRVEANLTGLRLAGDYGWQCCIEGLEMGEPGEVFTAGVTALFSPDTGRLQRVLETAILEPELDRALRSALARLIEDVFSGLSPNSGPPGSLGTLKMAIDHEFVDADGRIQRDQEPCDDCQDIICKAVACGLNVVLCKGDPPREEDGCPQQSGSDK